MIADLPTHPATSLKEAAEREEWYKQEIKRLRTLNAEIAQERSQEKLRANAREQQILDLGRLLKARNIDWRKEAVWTDPTAPPAP